MPILALFSLALTWAPKIIEGGEDAYTVYSAIKSAWDDHVAANPSVRDDPVGAAIDAQIATRHAEIQANAKRVAESTG